MPVQRKRYRGPANLRALQRSPIERGVNKGKVELLDKLLAREEMRGVWESLERLKPHGQEEEFFDACYWALAWPRQKKTRTQVLQQAREIAKMAQRLAGKLKVAQQDGDWWVRDYVYELLPRAASPRIASVKTIAGPNLPLEITDWFVDGRDVGPLRALHAGHQVHLGSALYSA